MPRTLAIIIISFLLISTCTAESKQKEYSASASKFTLQKDTIAINLKGEITHALMFRDKYYVLFEQSLLKYGGYGKRWLYIISNGKVEKIIDCPKEMKTIYLDFYVRNDSILLKPYMDEKSYTLNLTNFTWQEILQTDDLIYEDSDFNVFSLDFGEWGGETWFVDKKTGSEYVLECTTPLINKLDKTYYLTSSYQVHKIENPLNLTKCDSEVTYQNIQKTGKYHSWYSKEMGYETIYTNDKKDHFGFSYSPNIVSSFVFNNELLHVYETDTATYLARIINGNIEPFEQILEGVTFFNWSYSYRCRNLNGNNELLKFKTNNEHVFGLVMVDENKIFVTILVNNAEMKPPIIGAENSNTLLKKRLNTILVNPKNLTLTQIESEENKWKSFDITPNHKMGIGASWNLNNYVIDTNKAYLVVEDTIISNSVMYFATKETDLVRATIFNWEKTESSRFELQNEKLESQVFTKKYNDILALLTQELGQYSKSNKSKNSKTLIWEYKNEILIELIFTSQASFNRIRMVIYEKENP